MTDSPQTSAPEPAAPAAAASGIDAFVGRHQQMLWRFLRVLGCAGQRAEEIAQDALVIALQRGVENGPGPRAAAFLRQTARHLWLREQRADRRRAAHHAEAAERLWQREFDGDDGDGWLQALDRCLEQLPERSRAALDRTYRDGMGRAELGAELGIGEHGVRNLLHRLRAALRDCIERRRQA
ncbi:MAG: sigma-70 family RNA polymerase sigma factor [Planctomycetes bacterium]|nr:sigma-70 family RNA polymerase sigma factor [Planctomycetota bacterium]MCB9886323.1 sigma-70 family RNA polymerase sigma factor [Planctomycetota bacterium]